MVDEVITKQELIDAQKDAQSLDDFINGGDEQIVVTRLLKEYPTLANAIRQIYEKGGKFYPTLAEANADIANIRTDVYVITGDNGAYYKATAGATSLTKSPFDPVEQAKTYVDQGVVALKISADQEFNLFKYNESVGLTTPDFISGGVFTTADASESGRGFFTETFVSGVTYFGWTFPRTTQEKISAELYVKGDPEIVRVTFYTDTTSIITKQLELVATVGDVKKYALNDWSIPANTTRIRLMCYNSAASNRTIEYFKPYLGFGDKVVSIDSFDSQFEVKKTTALDMVQPPNMLSKDIVQFKVMPDYTTNASLTKTTLNNLPALKIEPVDGEIITRAGWTKTLVELGFSGEEAVSGSILIKVLSGAMPLRCYLQRFSGWSAINYVEMTPAFVGDNTYLYTLSDMTIPSNMDRVRLMFTGQTNSEYILSLPTIAKGGLITGTGIDNISLATSNESDAPEFEVNENTIADVVSRIQLPLTNGGLDLINGELIDRYADFNYFSTWGSSTIEAMSSLLRYDLMPLTGATQWFNGSRGGECVSHTSARMGARKLRCTFAAAIPASGSVNLATHNLNQHKLSYLKSNFTGTFEVESGEKIHGTVSYSASSSSGLIFTRTTSGSVINVPNIYEFIPDFDEKFLCGYAVMNVAKNDTDDPNLTGTEGLFLRTLEMYTNLKSTFKRCIILGNFVNKDSSVDEPERQKHVLDLNRRLKEHFGKVYIDVQEYICSADVWTDTGLTPTSEDLAYQAKGELAESLMLNFAHTSAVVNEQIVNKLIKNRMIELGWISL